MNTELFNVANYIIRHCPDITNMKLQKLVFYSQAYSLATYGERLVNADIEAWVYGPVIRSLYMEFSRFSFRAITENSPKGSNNPLTTNQINSISYILEHYGNMTAGDLSDKTHTEEPWLDAFQSSDWSENIISNEVIRSFYTQNPL